MNDLPQQPDGTSQPARPSDEAIGNFDPSEVKDGEVYRFLYTYYLHQDRQCWRRTETLLAVEVAALVGSYATQCEGRAFSIAAIASGTFVAFLIGLLVYRDLEIRNSFFSHFDSVHKPLRLRFTPKARFSRGRIILSIIIWGVVLGNIALALLAFKWSPWTIVPQN